MDKIKRPTIAIKLEPLFRANAKIGCRQAINCTLLTYQ